MCGLVGAFAFTGSGFKVTEPYITAMRDTMVHRGPDGGDTWIAEGGRIGLGHRRLSIIDLSAVANQPMANEDGSIVVVFNGEIYNHADIRAELEELGGHTWKTDHSDTEVIIHAFEEWGIECIHRFRGMFGIALWDGRTRELWLVRDRIGIKPVYYSIHDGRIVFASEIKALLADPDQKRAVDEEAFFHYLSFLTTPAPMTLFQGIRKMPSATWMRITEDGSIEEKRYWDAAADAEDLSGMGVDEIAKRLLEELRTSVKLRKIADVPVGVFLSGGIDSSTNAALFSEGEGGPVKTFCIGYEGEYDSYQNELHFARLMAEEVGADHHELLLTPKHLIDFLPRMVWLHDEPIADPVAVPIHYVSKLARDNGVIVCQVGEGSDELFCGYPGWYAQLRRQHLHDLPIPRVIKRAGLRVAAVLGWRTTRRYEYLSRAVRGEPVFWGGFEGFTEEQKRDLLSSRLRSEFSGRTSWEALRPVWDRFRRSRLASSRLAWMSYLDLNLRLPELLLMRVDKMTMGVSLEGRVPFLDHRFVELAMGMDEDLKVRGGELKYILKKAIRGLIPDILIDRPKQGFAVPLREWVLGELGEHTDDALRHFAAGSGLVDRDEIERMLGVRHSIQLWIMLNVAMWWRTYIEPEDFGAVLRAHVIREGGAPCADS
jgi:asparagine synthase (glutamine-hydrolysing)